MTALATLAGRLTLPYQRGAEYAAIPLGADAAGATPFPPTTSPNTTHAGAKTRRRPFTLSLRAWMWRATI